MTKMTVELVSDLINIFASRTKVRIRFKYERRDRYYRKTCTGWDGYQVYSLWLLLIFLYGDGCVFDHDSHSGLEAWNYFELPACGWRK